MESRMSLADFVTDFNYQQSQDVSYTLFSPSYGYDIPDIYQEPNIPAGLAMPSPLPPPSFPGPPMNQTSFKHLNIVAEIGNSFQSPNDNISTEGELITTSSAQQKAQEIPKISRRIQKRQKWDSIKDEVNQLYVIERMTLEATMEELQMKHNFKASLRTWKTQVKEWNFDKYLSKRDMAILVAKAEKRARDEGKETTFYSRGQEIDSQKFINFKKRKHAELIDAPSPSAATPMNITYDTPKYENDLPNIQEEEKMVIAEEGDRPFRDSITPKPSSPWLVPLETAEKDLTFFTNSEWWLSKSQENLSDLEELELWMELANHCLDQGALNASEKALLTAMLRYLQRTSTYFYAAPQLSSSNKILNLGSLFNALFPCLRQPHPLSPDQQARDGKEYFLKEIVNEIRTYLQTGHCMLSSHPSLLQLPAICVVLIFQLWTLAFDEKICFQSWPEHPTITVNALNGEQTYQSTLHMLCKAVCFAQAGKRSECNEYLNMADTFMLWFWSRKSSDHLISYVGERAKASV